MAPKETSGVVLILEGATEFRQLMEHAAPDIAKELERELWHIAGKAQKGSRAAVPSGVPASGWATKPTVKPRKKGSKFGFPYWDSGEISKGIITRRKKKRLAGGAYLSNIQLVNNTGAGVIYDLAMHSRNGGQSQSFINHFSGKSSRILYRGIDAMGGRAGIIKLVEQAYLDAEKKYERRVERI